jgi:cell filamentation protein, protein adenylyltransferase
LLQRQPIVTPGALVTATALTAATVNKSLTHLVDLGIVVELTHRRRGRVFSYRRYVKELASERETASLRGGGAGGRAVATD